MVRLCKLLAGLLVAASTMAFSPVGMPAPDTLAVAGKVARSAKRLSTIWPGYWPVDQAMIIQTPGQGALLLSPAGVRPPGFRAVSPAPLADAPNASLFHHPGDLPDSSAPFRLNYPIGGGHTAVLVQSKPGEAEAAASLAFHEQFHAFQRTAFRGGTASQFIDPAAIPDRAVFSAGADIERRVLAAALSARSLGEKRGLLRRYLALRREREAAVPAAVTRVEAGFETLEGVARWVERTATARVFGGGEDAVRRTLIAQLGADLSQGSGSYLGAWFRGRSYAVGGALCHILNDLRPGWRAEVEGGARLDVLLASAVGFEEGPGAAALARDGRERFGYAKRLAELRPAIDRISRGEITTREQFYALAPYRVTFAYVPPKVNGVSAVSLGLSSSSMSQLTPSQMVLPAPEVVTAALPFAELTVRKRPFLRDASGSREELTALLPAAPRTAGGAALGLGEHRLAGLILEAEGYRLAVRSPVHVAVTANGMTVSASSEPQREN